MPFKDHFSKQAKLYQTFHQHYPTPRLKRVAQSCARHTLACDIATGNGQVTVELTKYFTQVVATDASLHQLQQAKSTQKLHYCAALAEQQPFVAGSLDLITVAQALHWFNIPQFLAHCSECLTRHGVLAIWCYGRIFSGSDKLNRLINEIYEELLDQYRPPERQLIETAYRTIEFPFETLEFNHFVIRQNWTATQINGYIKSWSATQNYFSTDNKPEQLNTKLTAIKHQLSSTIEMTWTIRLVIGKPNLFEKTT